MSLIKCPECGKEFSDKAAACPNCGCPTDVINSTSKTSEETEIPEEAEVQDLSAIWSTVPDKKSSLAPVKPRITQKVSAVKVDEVNQMFQIHGAVPTNGKKSGIIGKSIKGVMAFSTVGMSLVAEKMIGSGKNKVGSNTWYKFSDLVSYELLEDDSVVTSGGVGQALIAGAVFGGFGAVAGGLTAKRTQKKRVESIYIRVTLNSFANPCVLIPLITKPTKTNSKEYQIAFIEAQKILSVLDVIAHNQ